MTSEVAVVSQKISTRDGTYRSVFDFKPTKKTFISYIKWLNLIGGATPAGLTHVQKHHVQELIKLWTEIGSQPPTCSQYNQLFEHGIFVSGHAANDELWNDYELFLHEVEDGCVSEDETDADCIWSSDDENVRYDSDPGEEPWYSGARLDKIEKGLSMARSTHSCSKRCRGCLLSYIDNESIHVEEATGLHIFVEAPLPVLLALIQDERIQPPPGLPIINARITYKVDTSYDALIMVVEDMPHMEDWCRQLFSRWLDLQPYFDFDVRFWQEKSAKLTVSCERHRRRKSAEK